MDDRTNAHALATALKARRHQLDLSQADVEKRGGPNAATVRRIERGEVTEVRARTIRQLEHALDWRDGVVEKIVAGTASEAEIAEQYHRVYATDAFGVGEASGPKIATGAGQAGMRLGTGTEATWPVAGLSGGGDVRTGRGRAGITAGAAGTGHAESDLALAARLLGKLDGYTDPPEEVQAAADALRRALPLLHTQVELQ